VTPFVPYDTSYRPPAPVVPVGVAGAGSDRVMVPMLVDTGADVTLLPAETVRRLQLPRVDTVVVSGFGGAKLTAAVHAATLTLGGTQLVARVVASDEAILGRDVLARFELELDGPRARLALRGKVPRRTRRRS
jgi:predicted aspartyl protease